MILVLVQRCLKKKIVQCALYCQNLCNACFSTNFYQVGGFRGGWLAARWLPIWLTMLHRISVRCALVICMMLSRCIN